MSKIEETRAETNRRAESIPHAHPECTGKWGLEGLGEDLVAKCMRCGATHHATPTVRLAAINENYAAIYMQRLTVEGGG